MAAGGCALRPAGLGAGRQQVASWADQLLALIFPPVCAACNRPGPLICSECAGQMATIAEPICERCGRTLLYEAPICGRCLGASFSLEQVRTPLAYKDPTARIIHRLKYEGLFALARPLAQIMIDAWPDWEPAPDLILPIPLHPRRQRRRGFNQSASLAKHLGTEVGLPVEERALRRMKNTIPQIGLSPAEREENVRQAFAAEGKLVEAQYILLIDDVYTTGATMRAAATALLSSGAAGVSAYCLARSVY